MEKAQWSAFAVSKMVAREVRLADQHRGFDVLDTFVVLCLVAVVNTGDSRIHELEFHNVRGHDYLCNGLVFFEG
jgi:hypothetical protein